MEQLNNVINCCLYTSALDGEKFERRFINSRFSQVIEKSFKRLRLSWGGLGKMTTREVGFFCAGVIYMAFCSLTSQILSASKGEATFWTVFWFIVFMMTVKIIHERIPYEMEKPLG